MALFSYRALNARGQAERGTLDAASENEAKSILQGRSVFPLEVRPSKTIGFDLRSFLNLGRGPRISVQELAGFTRQFATLLEATIPYDTALEMILRQTSHLGFKSVLADVRGKVVEGAYLADAFRAYPLVFPPMVVNMVRAGETSGTLTLVMNRLGDYYENVSRLRAKMFSAMVYPAFMMVFGSGVVLFMLTYIIPKISALFDNFGVTLPLPTRILIAASAVITQYWWAILIALVAFGWGTARFLKTERGKALRDRVELKVPLWRVLHRKMMLERFTQTLSTMIKSGVELKDALVVSSQVMENRVFVAAMGRVIFDVQNRGLPLAAAMRREDLFPEDLCQMVAIGEETASLDAMLDNIAARLSREVVAISDAATAMLEPVMILVMGAGVAFIVISILLPMLQMNQLVG